MTHSITYRRKFISVFLAWLIFIGLDFLFHASLFSSLWKEDISALKSPNDLATMIPAGYLSFFLLTSLVGYVFFKIFKTKPDIKQALQFGLIFSLLFSLGNFFGLYSYVDLPVKHLMVFNFVYLLEILGVTVSLHFIAFSTSLKKSTIFSIATFILLIIIGIIIQNLFPSPG